MGGLSIWHILIVGMIALLLFGGSGKISDLMGDVAKGVKSFRHGLKDEDENEALNAERTTPRVEATPVAADKV